MTTVEARERWHGTIGGYTNHYCRCDDCRNANRVSRKRRRDQRCLEPIPPNVQHGNRNTYWNWGCTCAPCRAANRDYNREWRRRAAATPR